MDGVVLGYETEEGVIKGADGSRYRFHPSQWRSPRPPIAGMKVDFVAEGGEAKEIYVVNPATGAILTAVDTIEKSEKTMPTVVYVCYLAAFLYGFTMLAGVIIAYLNRGDAEGKWYRSHYDFQIAIFWKSLIGFLVAIPLMFVFGIGIIIMLCTYVWVLVKIIKGWRLLSEGREAEK